jgi:hypothetical protein
MSELTLAKIVRRLPLYFALALAGLATIGLLVAISISTGIEIEGRWIGLAMFSCVLLWAMVRESRSMWMQPKFWMAVTGFLAIHLAVFVPILRSYPQWRVVWFAFITPPEAAVFGMSLDIFFAHPAKKTRRNGNQENPG